MTTRLSRLLVALAALLLALTACSGESEQGGTSDPSVEWIQLTVNDMGVALLHSGHTFDAGEEIELRLVNELDEPVGVRLQQDSDPSGQGAVFIGVLQPGIEATESVTFSEPGRYVPDIREGDPDTGFRSGDVTVN